MLAEVKGLMERQAFPVRDHLIQNPTPMREKESPALIRFRWRYRVCNHCDEPFDIEDAGRFYKCGDCV